MMWLTIGALIISVIAAVLSVTKEGKAWQWIALLSGFSIGINAAALALEIALSTP